MHSIDDCSLRVSSDTGAMVMKVGWPRVDLLHSIIAARLGLMLQLLLRMLLLINDRGV